MKPSSYNNDFLSQQQLEDFLRGNMDAEGKTRVKKLLDDCELSKEAVAGYTAVPLAIGDIPSLKKSIAAKSGMATSFPMNVFVVGLGTVLLVGMGYVLWPKEDKTPHFVQNIPASSPVIIPQTEQAVQSVDLTPKSEHFVNPEMSITPKATISAGVVKDSSNAKSNDGSEPVVAPGKEMKRIDTFMIHPVVPKKPEVGYNASVGFIMDLKVTEFEKYNRKMVEVDALEFTGVSAQFDDFASQKAAEDENVVREVPAEQFLNEGLKAFHNGHYGRCIEKMEVLRKSDPNDLNAAFYMGVSYVKLEMYEKAIPFFDQILNSPNNVFHEEANWYKALALIGNGNTEAAKKVLTEISQKDGFYKEKAAEKLKEL
jgi:hypothetical protein